MGRAAAGRPLLLWTTLTRRAKNLAVNPLPALLLVALAVANCAAEVPAKFLSHPPLRPLPTVSSRPMPAGPIHCVDSQGDDSANGSEKHPWKTNGHALGQLKPGETLCLRA